MTIHHPYTRILPSPVTMKDPEPLADWSWEPASYVQVSSSLLSGEIGEYYSVRFLEEWGPEHALDRSTEFSSIRRRWAWAHRRIRAARGGRVALTLLDWHDPFIHKAYDLL